MRFALTNGDGLHALGFSLLLVGCQSTHNNSSGRQPAVSPTAPSAQLPATPSSYQPSQGTQGTQQTQQGPQTTPQGPKKGLGMWGTAGREGARVGASWYYNWQPSPSMGDGGALEYVPMIWGPRDDKDSAYTAIKNASSPNALGPNEPDKGGDGNKTMTPDEVIALWPKLMATGKRLGSPSVAGDYQWLDSFMTKAQSAGYRVDFIAVHSYPNGQDLTQVDALQKLLTDLHTKYNRPIWLTEFGFCTWSTAASITDAQKQLFISKVLAMLEGLSFVERYSWFSDRSFNQCEVSSIFDGGGNLTVTGQAYSVSGLNK